MESSSFQGTGSRPIRPNNININTRLGSTGDDLFYSSPQRISDLLSSSVNSSPCSFISATSTGENDNNNNIELVSCSFTASSASRIRTSSSSNSYFNNFNNTVPERMSEGRREMEGSVSGSVRSSNNNNNNCNWEYSHNRHKQGQEHLLYATQGHGQEQGQGQHQCPQGDKASFEDRFHDLNRPRPDHIQQEQQQQQQQQQQTTGDGDSQGHDHYRHSSLNHDNNNPSCPKLDRETTSTPIPSPLRPTTCLLCQSVPLPRSTPIPPAAATASSFSLIAPNSPTTISSGQQQDPSPLPSTSLPVVCMCPTTKSSFSSSSSSPPARKYRTVSTTVASLDLASALAQDPVVAAHLKEASTTISTISIATITTAATTNTAAASDNTTFAEKPLTTDDMEDSDPKAADWITTLSPPMPLNNKSTGIHTTTLMTVPVLLSSVSLPSVVDSSALPGVSPTSPLASRPRYFSAAPAAATGPFSSSSTAEAGGSGIFQALSSTTNQGSSSYSSSSALSLSRDTYNLLPGLHSMHQHQFFHHLALQQQQYDNDTDNAIEAAEASSSSAAFHSGLNNTFVDEDSPSPTSSAAGSPSRMKFGNRRNSNNNNQGILSSTPDGSSSASSSAFHSPSNSITWASPSRTQHHHHNSSSPMTTDSPQFASLGEFNRIKGKGIVRGFYRSSKDERRRLHQTQQIQPWKATMDGLPREIKIHIFRYLSTFQLVRVSRVSRSWRSIAMDGSLWKVIDTTRFYKIIKDDQLRVLGTAASNFLRYANFRGCVQLSGDSLRAIAEHCPNVERLDLTGCRSVSSKSIADVCMNMPLLLHLELAGLQSVNNYTLQAMAVYCRSLQVLNLAWCKQISGFGLSNLTRSCQDLRKLNVSGCSGLEDRWMPVMGMNLPRLREICLNGCGSLTDRGLIGLLSGLSVASSRKHRKWRMRKRMATSVRVSSLGHLLVNQSSSCGDDDGMGGDDDEDEEDELDRARRELEEEDEEYAMEDDSDRESEVDGDDEDDDGNQAKASSSSNAAAAVAATSTTGSNGRSSEEGLQARLDYLGLSHCRLLTTEALRAIGHYCNRHLRRLELSGCESLGDEGLIILAQNCTRLRLLDLEDVNLLTDASLRAFGMYLPKLERLSLSYCENVTDQGIIRMLRPAPNPTTLSTANNTVIANNADSAASLCCKRLVHLELDNCLLITDRLLLEFANVLEERKALAIEKMKERERKREEKRERIRQKKRKSSLNLLRSASTPSAYASSPVVSEDQQQQQTRSTSFEGVYLSRENNGEEGSTAMASGSGSGSGSFIASRPVNIPVRLRMNPSLAAETAGPSNGGSFVSSYTSSPLQPRSVLASTSISDEIVVKKTRPGLRIMVPTRSASTTSTTSTSTSSSSLALWPSALQSRRRRLAAAAAAAAAAASKNGKYIRPRPRRRPVRPTLQIFDCRNITLEGVEAAQLRCPSLAVKSYYSWSNPSTSVPAASTLGFGGSGGSLEEAFEGELEGDEEEDDDEDADADDENGSGVAGRRHGSRRGTSSIGGNAGLLHGHGGGGGGSSSGSANSSQTSLHHLHVQQQHLQLLQLQRLNRPANLLQRARLGLLGSHGHGGHGHGHAGHRDSQCTIL